MSKKANPKLIGSFVIGAAVLVVAGVLAFGSGQWFAEFEKYVSYFRGNVQGLRIGGPVTFRGVPIGQVTGINLLVDSEKLDFFTEVLFEVDPDGVIEVKEDQKSPQEHELEAMVKKGLRAQLVQQSFVTGQLGVNLNFFPDTEIKTSGLSSDRFEIPTIPSTIEKLESTIKRIAQKLDNIDLQKIVDDLEATVAGVREIVSGPHAEKALADLDATIAQALELLTNLNKRVDPLATSLLDTSQAAQDALEEAQRLFADARPAISDAQRALKRAEKLMSTASTVIEPGSPLHFELVSALREVAGAARSLRSLADSLERNPKSLLFGRQAPGGR